MIGQYIFTRNNGTILIGPHGNPDEGYDCVGRTDSILPEDLPALQKLSLYTPSVRQGGGKHGYLPHWGIHWLPSGAMAVSKVTYFPAQAGVRKRDNLISHIYVLDRQTALQVSDHIEQLFTLPFIDYDLTDKSQARDLEVLTRLQDFETPEQCGAEAVEIVPLNALLNRHLPIYTDEIRNVLEGVADSVVHGNRQMLFAYDCYAPNAQWLCAQWLGWVYRLLPLSIRSQTNLAFPYHGNCANSVHLALIPRSLIQINRGFIAYSNSDAPDAPSVPMGFNYLFVNSDLYHQTDVHAQLPELFNAEYHYFCAFLQQQIDTIYDAPDMEASDQLQELYRGLYELGWQEHPLLTDADGLELMVSSLEDLHTFMELSEDAYTDRLYFWLDQLHKIAEADALPPAEVVKLHRSMLTQLYHEGSVQPDDTWLTLLKQALETTTSPRLAQQCVDWAAISCAKLLNRNQDGLAAARTWFSQVRCGNDAVDHLILLQLMTEGSEARQRAWVQAGVYCDADTSMNRLLNYVLSRMETCTDSGSFFQALESSGPLINMLPPSTLDTASHRLLEFTTQWIAKGYLTTGVEEMEALLRRMDRTAPAAVNMDKLEYQLVQPMITHCQKCFREAHAYSDRISDLRLMQQIAGGVSHPGLLDFLSAIYGSILCNVRERLRTSPLECKLICQAAELLDVSGQAPDWDIYDKICAAALGRNAQGEKASGTEKLPDFLTPQWLCGLREQNALRYRKGYPNTIILFTLDCLLNDESLAEELGSLVRFGKAGVIVEQIRVQMFREGQCYLTPNVLYSLCHRTKQFGMTYAHALILLEKYSADDFIDYLDWLRDNRSAKDYLDLLDALYTKRDLLCSLDQELFLRILEHFHSAFYSPDSILVSQGAVAEKLFKKLWKRYGEGISPLQCISLNMKKRRYEIVPGREPVLPDKKAAPAPEAGRSGTQKPAEDSAPVAPAPEVPSSDAVSLDQQPKPFVSRRLSSMRPSGEKSQSSFPDDADHSNTPGNR